MVARGFRDGRRLPGRRCGAPGKEFAGYGMNASIADGMNIALLVANVLEGWVTGHADAYEAERHPITEQVSRLASGSTGHGGRDGREHGATTWHRASIRQALRCAKVIGAVTQLNVPQFARRLNFGYYEGLPVIATTAKAPP